MTDETKGRDLPGIDPKLLRLPSGLASSGDPCDDNPFPLDSHRHQVWARATRHAEEQVARLKSEWMFWQNRHRQKPVALAWEIRQHLEEFHEEKNRVLAKEFELWGARALQIVFTDEDVRRVDAWLVDYAEAFLETRAEHFLAAGVPGRAVEREISVIRDRVIACVLHLKAEARRFCSIREAQRRQADEDGPPAAPSVKSAPGADAAGGRLSTRAAWLEAALRARGWTATELQRQGGPDTKTTRRMLAGEPVRETVLEKLVHALSLRGRVDRSQIPDD